MSLRVQRPLPGVKVPGIKDPPDFVVANASGLNFEIDSARTGNVLAVEIIGLLRRQVDQLKPEPGTAFPM